MPTVPRFHAYSSIHDRQESISDQQTIDRVLESSQGRKTPTLFSAPTLHWDLSTPFLVNPSVSTLDSVAEEETETDSGDKEKKQEPKVKGKKGDRTPPPSFNPNLARDEASACNAIPHPRSRGKKTATAGGGATRRAKSSHVLTARAKAESGDSCAPSAGKTKEEDKAQQLQQRPPSSTASTLHSLPKSLFPFLSRAL
ncbi:hypothetical protein A1F94_011096 [Pyrenophora tritici-repentis]|nr:hypothetical protein A1F94_011096 [Pyrenophora tritici-repentis]KAI1540779.1 hypothetical protein PtrSN001A_004079 [Pyrenophora tritici-repentis]KAI1574464.1 hypothetical protein PtrEW7m1_006834 [Pyrenophora tritici-repentis]KAI1591882.1 hypothetical protein PtrEW13061_004229 [Pyrenophora tritici-repentis]PZD43472.1 hypothetical protein A1F97_02846 [Pyrenophora tritici-repentis]